MRVRGPLAKFLSPRDPFVSCSPIPEPAVEERHEGTWVARAAVSEAGNE
jgi:hypothetical protein